MRLVGDRLERLSPAATALARAIAVLGADAEPGRARALAGLEASEAIAAEEELRDERVLDADACALRAPAGRGGGARGDRRKRRRPSCMRARPRCSPMTAWTISASPSTWCSAPPRGDAEVVATLRRAAETARRVGAFDDAARLLERALAEPPAPELVDAVDFERGRSMLDAGEEDGARVLARVAQRAADVVRARRCRAPPGQGASALQGRGAEAVPVLRGVLEALPDADREMRLELLVELAFIGSAGLAGYARRRADDRRRGRGRRPAAPRASGWCWWPRRVMRRRAVRRIPAGGRPCRCWRCACTATTPTGSRSAALTFGAIAMLMNADALDDAERAMDAAARGRRGRWRRPT